MRISRYLHYSSQSTSFRTPIVAIQGNFNPLLHLTHVELNLTKPPVHVIIIWTVTAVLEIYSVAYFFLFVLQCQPSSFFWNRYAGATDGTCIDPTITVNATYAYSAISCWVDWTLAILPVFIVWKLQMNVRTKISVAMVLAMGAM